MKKTSIYLKHILLSIHKIEKYTLGYTKRTFQSDEKTQDAVVRQLEIIGEAAGKISQAKDSLVSDIPWQDIKDFRNVLAHEYWMLDLDIIWKAVKEDIPKLKQGLLKLDLTKDK